MPYARLYYHVIWATKGRRQLIDADVGRILDVAVRAACRDVESQVFAFGFMPDHVHLAASIPPRHAISAVIGRIKGASSHAVNAAQSERREPFAWQAEYGVLSFGQRALGDVVAYVNNQPDRHANNQIFAALERWTESD
jgi:putative transposase